MKQSAPVSLVVHGPETEQGRKVLAEAVAGVHAAFVSAALAKQNRSPAETRSLRQAVARAVRARR